MMAGVKTPGKIVLLALLLLLSVGASESRAATGAQDDQSRWIPAIGISSGLFVQRFQGVVGAGDILCSAPAPTCTVGRPIPDPIIASTVVGRQRTITPFIGVNLELSTPSLIDSFGAPSLFAHVDFAYTFGFDQSLALSGAPGPLEPPPPVPPLAEEIYWKGQGAYANYKASDFQFSGGIGVVFHFDVLDRRVRFKPSLEYMRNSATFQGGISRVVQITSPFEAKNCPPSTLPDRYYRCIELSGSTTQVFHSIGPGLELEVDAGRKGPLVLALYGGAQAYAILGSNRVEFSDVDEFGETAEWSYIANRWFFRGSVGLRFRWAPE